LRIKSSALLSVMAQAAVGRVGRVRAVGGHKDTCVQGDPRENGFVNIDVTEEFDTRAHTHARVIGHKRWRH
jgi:hypothetical protein